MSNSSEACDTQLPVDMPATTIFNSLACNPRPWKLTRKLWSENPSDLQGKLEGIATFSPLASLHSVNQNTPGKDVNKRISEMVYKEEGETAAPGLHGVAGMRWTKKYIWRLADGKGEDTGLVGDGSIEVWFVKIADGNAKSSCTATTTGKDIDTPDERDYMFHDLRFASSAASGTSGDLSPERSVFGELESPPEIYPDDGETRVLHACGHHLCVNDTYQTTYSFQLRGKGSSAEVIRWASEHVVTGPQKNQVITNIYQRE